MSTFETTYTAAHAALAEKWYQENAANTASAAVYVSR